MKPAWKTTEFWGRGIVSVVGLLIAVGIFQTGSVGHYKSLASYVNNNEVFVKTIMDGSLKLLGLIIAGVLQWQQGRDSYKLKELELKTKGLL